MHDPNVIGWILKPDLYGGRLCNVEIECESELCLGMTVADWWGVTQRKKNGLWIKAVDTAGFFDLLIGRLAHLG